MGIITDTSVAAGTSIEVINQPLAFGSEVLARKIVILATADPAFESKHPTGVPFLVLSPEDVAGKCGAGTMAHRLAIAVFRGNRDAVPVSVLVEEDNPDAVTAAGTLTLTVQNPAAGTVYLYVAGKLYAVAVNKSDTALLLGDRIAAALSADESCPVSAGNIDGVVTLTAKSKGAWGNAISVAINQRPAENQALPVGVTLVVSPMANGQGNPDVEKDLKNGLGSGDSANEEGFTAIVHGYGKDTVVLDAVSEYNGIGNENAGLYQETIARPFRSLVGDTGTGSEGLASLIAFTNLRTLDRTSGVIARPGSLTHPAEIAAEAIGYMEMVNAGKAEAGYNEAPLSGVDPGYTARAAGQDWTTEYTNRDLAVHSGIGPTVVKGGAVLLTNVVSFYRPGNIPEKNRAFRRMRDISIIQNIQATYKQIFGSTKWTNFTVVEDVANVTNTASRALARDTGVVKDDLLSMIEAFMSRGWIYSTKPSVAFLKTALSVQVRDGGTGFNTQVPYVLSGEGNILDQVAILDASFAVMAQLG